MLEIARENRKCTISLGAEETLAVQRAVSHLGRDLEWVTNCQCSVTTNRKERCGIYIGTIGMGGIIDEKIASKLLKTDAIKTEQGEYCWEGYIIQEIDGSLYIGGVGRRGTIYGVYELSRIAGVSPWYFWADVPVKKKRVFELPMGYYHADYPSVQYRGIFLNDEEELNAWAVSHTQDDTIGPETYEHIFELLLRLKANYIWPAMHVNCFNADLRNGALAEEMGIVVGTSHCDMLLRSNQNEWQPWLEKKGYQDLAYDYSIPGKNRERLKEYWRESVEQNKNYEVCYTVGMRGIHDTGFVTNVIDQDNIMTEEEKQQAKVQLLGQVISEQRNILKDVLGTKKMLQTFVPYKEVLPLYDVGLELPDDVTLIWVDDNHGYMRRYPNEKERMRSGGHGLYYHSSYWAPPPMSYLFINSIPLAHMGNELRKSYESGIQKIWVLNVGALKPLEQDIEFFLQTAWEAGKEKGLTEDASAFTESWINENFSGNHGKEAAQIYDIFAQTTNVRKIEHLDNDIFSQTAYGNEAGRRIVYLEDIFHRANRIWSSLPVEERDAFVELFLMKIHASYLSNSEFYYADRSAVAYSRGNMQAADEDIRLSRCMMDYRRWLIYFYNKVMASGKWDNILTPENFAPPVTAMYPAGKPALSIKKQPELSVVLWNQEDEIVFQCYGKKKKYIEIGNKGVGTIRFHMEISDGMDWVSVSMLEGSVQTEVIISITALNVEKHIGEAGNIRINAPDLNQSFEIPVSVENRPLILDAKGYVEAEGYISIPADGYSDICMGEKAKKIGWRLIEHIGRGEGNAMMAYHPKLVTLESLSITNPYMEYNFYTVSEGEFLLEIYRFLTLDSQGCIRLGVSVDSESPILVESEIKDEWLGDWKWCVMDNGEKLKVRLPFVPKGHHRLRLYMIDNYVTITKLVIYTKEVKESCLGPQWSVEVKGDGTLFDRKAAVENREYPDNDMDSIEKELQKIYCVDMQDVPLHNIVYAAKDFWHKDLLYMKNEEYPQTAMGKARYKRDTNGTKDIVGQFGKGIFVESNRLLALEAEYALEDSIYAWRTPSRDQNRLMWTHLQAETDGRTGLAMHVNRKNIVWKAPEAAPGMHYKVSITHAGIYHVWMLIRFYDDTSDACCLALDGRVQPFSEQFSKGRLFTFSTAQIYFWSHISDLDIAEGIHTLSVFGVKSGLRIDRIYLTQGTEKPSMDADWQASERKEVIGLKGRQFNQL